MINYTLPYSVTWHVYKVNDTTWDEDYELRGICSVSVDRDCTDSVPLLEASTMTFDSVRSFAFDEGYYRIVADIAQEPKMERVPIATLLYQSSDETIDYGMKQTNVKGVSVLYPASVVYMANGSFVPSGSNGAEWVVQQLRRVLRAPVSMGTSGGFSLKRHVVYDESDTVLSAVWSVLDAGRWTLQINGRGEVLVMKKPKESDSKVMITARDLHPSLKKTVSKKGIPNRYVVKSGMQEAIAVNDDPLSETSIPNVGYIVEAKLDKNPYLLEGETIQAYARRRLEEESTVSIMYDYDREYRPDLYPMSLVDIAVTDYDILTNLRIAKQKLTLGQGIYVSETSSQERKYWSR